MKLASKIESILFAAAKPFSVRKLADITKESSENVEEALLDLKTKLEEQESGLMLQQHGKENELVTHPDVSDLVTQVVRSETQGELTRPSLEALTILAYRGPLTRPELEQIRGVQSSLILRNLMMRGLIEEKGVGPLGQPNYVVTFDFLNALGLKSLDDLPQYKELSSNSVVDDVLADLERDELKGQGAERPKG